MTKQKEPSFEAALARLEEIVATLEKGQAPLDDSLKLFEEGVALSRFCSGKLDEIERKIEILDREGGKLKAEPFDGAEENGA
jgi:exodeoxyribonuclease VII small subunit